VERNLQKMQAVLSQADELYNSKRVEQALEKMAEAITVRLYDANPLLLCVMIGGIVTTGKLLTQLKFPLQLDYIHVTRYRGKTQGGEMHWRAEPTLSLTGRTVLVIDDILDEGLTLAAIKDYCWSAGAEEVFTAILLEKMLGREKPVQADFLGLTVEDRYVFGYGMDYNNYLRNAAGIYAVASYD
jgi:hypoxanthine phosphoribosyltransferase